MHSIVYKTYAIPPCDDALLRPSVAVRAVGCEAVAAADDELLCHGVLVHDAQLVKLLAHVRRGALQVVQQLRNAMQLAADGYGVVVDRLCRSQRRGGREFGGTRQLGVFDLGAIGQRLGQGGGQEHSTE